MREINQFQQDAILTVKCTAEDVTYARNKANYGCEEATLNTIVTNTPTEKIFDFLPVFRTKKSYIK